MDDSAKQVLRKVIRRIPSNKLPDVLRKWGHLSEEQFSSLEFTQAKWILCENLLSLCEENDASMRHMTELEMIYRIENPAQASWTVCQLVDPDEEAETVELLTFKNLFKAHLKQLISHVSVKIKKHEDEAVWIRIAWGDNFTQPNHFSPTYVVLHLQTPYVFLSGLTSKCRPLLHQVLIASTHHGAIKDAHLSGRSLTALRDLVMRQYKQVFPVLHPTLLQEKSPVPPPSHENIEPEHAKLAEKRLQVAAEVFGDGLQPKLETAVYKLETRFRGNGDGVLAGREELFRGVVKFSSTNLLESLRDCVSSGIASAPVSPLLSSITRKGRNYFVITDPPGPRT